MNPHGVAGARFETLGRRAQAELSLHRPYASAVDVEVHEAGEVSAGVNNSNRATHIFSEQQRAGQSCMGKDSALDHNKLGWLSNSDKTVLKATLSPLTGGAHDTLQKDGGTC